jgi:hypothetical protein
MKINLMLSQLNADIKLDPVTTDTKSAKKEMISGLKEHQLDKELLKELKISIADDSSLSETRSKSSSDLTANSNQDSDSDPNIDTEENGFYKKGITESFEPYQPETISDLTDDIDVKLTPVFSKKKKNNSFVDIIKNECDLSIINEETHVDSMFESPKAPPNSENSTITDDVAEERINLLIDSNIIT